MGMSTGARLGWLALPCAWAAWGCTDAPVYVLGRLSGERETPRDPDAGEPCAPEGLVRDYAFSGEGTAVADRLGGPPGEVLGGATLDDSGELTLDGEDDYVDLPNGLLAGLSGVTVVLWVRHLGGPAYTRLFDFGVGSDGEDPAPGLGTVGRSYLSATPMTGFVPSRLAALVSNEGSAGEIAAVTDRRLDDALHLVAVAASTGALELFHDGELLARVPSSVPLSTIEDVNNWLGRSQYDADPHQHASYASVRIFDRVLPSCAIRALVAEGPPGP